MISSAIVDAERCVGNLVQFLMLVLDGTTLILVGLVLVDELLIQAVVRRVCTTKLLLSGLGGLEVVVVLSK